MTLVRSLASYGYLALLVGALVACAADPSKQAASSQAAMKDDPSKGIICTNEIPTGSALRVKKCTTPEQREEQRRQSEHQMVLEPARGNAR